MPLDVPQLNRVEQLDASAAPSRADRGSTEGSSSLESAEATPPSPLQEGGDDAFDSEALQAAFRRPFAAGSPVRHRTRNDALLGHGNFRRFYRLGRLRGLQHAIGASFLEHDIGPLADTLLGTFEEGDPQDVPVDLKAGTDPFRHYVALLEAGERATAMRRRGRLLERIDVALQRTWDDHHAEIVAGFNTAPSLTRFAQKVSEWDDFRQVYYDCVVTGSSMASAFKTLLARFGPDRVQSAIETLRNAIVADLASPLVSADRVRMLQQQSDLEHNRIIAALMGEIDRLIRNHAAVAPTARRVVDLLNHVLDYVGGSAGDTRLYTICQCLAGPDREVTGLTRHAAREFLRNKIPVFLWSSADDRTKALFAAEARAR